LLFAALVALHVILLAGRTARMHADQAKLLRPAVFLTALLLLQLILGTAAYFSKFTVILGWSYEIIVLVTTTHLITGALMLVTGLVFTLRAYRLSTPSSGPRQANVLAEQYSV
jgi:heme A synthase